MILIKEGIVGLAFAILFQIIQGIDRIKPFSDMIAYPPKDAFVPYYIAYRLAADNLFHQPCKRFRCLINRVTFDLQALKALPVC